jgi:CIC family chloride channel protein
VNGPLPKAEPVVEAAVPSGREEPVFLVLAILIGVLSGMAVVCFQVAIEYSRIYLLGSSLAPASPRVFLVPAAAGVIIGIVVVRVFPRVRGSGVNQTKAALYIYDGYIPFRTVIGKFLMCVLSIGSGHSLGPEDPSLQMGAGIASAIARRLRLSREKLRLIAPVGAAAGLAAAFNTPIAAVLFVIEEVIGRWSAGVLGAVVLSAVSSVVIERWFMGSEPLFRIPAYRLEHPGELLAYAVLGVAGGFASLVFVKLVGWLRRLLKAQPRWTQYLQPAAAGLIVGLIGSRFPQVMGAGYEYIDQAMHNQYAWELLGILAGLKILATTLSFTSGTPGGMFAPTLFMGAMLGAAVGSVEHIILPHLTVPMGAYALVGMGALFAGIMRTPMTSVFMVLELSGNYAIILPVIISNAIAYLISRTFQRTPVFDMLSRQDGLDLPSMEEQREQRVLRVEDAMRPPLPRLHLDEVVDTAWRRVRDRNEDHILAGDDLGAWFMTTKRELRAQLDGHQDATIAQRLKLDRVPDIHPDQPLEFALREIGDWPYLPVVHRANPAKLVGVISLADIVERYRKSRT